MNFSNPAHPAPAQPNSPVPPAAPLAPPSLTAGRQVIGRLIHVSGSQVTVGLSSTPNPAEASRATVGKFLGIVSSGSVVIGMITEISERPPRDQEPHCRSTAKLDLVGELKTAASGA